MNTSSMQPSPLRSELEPEKKLYENDYPKLFSMEEIPDPGLVATLPVLVAKSIINRLINQGGDLILNRLLQRKIRSHTKTNYNWLMNAVLDCELIDHESHSADLADDIEPPLEQIDSWGRYHVNLQTKNETEQLQTFDWQKAKLKVGPLVVDEKNSIARAREKAKKHLLEIEKNEVPKAVDLKDEDARDVLEERLRDEKQRKIIKLMQEETHRQAQEKELQANMKTKHLLGDRNRKPYTYDFDGKIIIMNHVKQENLPSNFYVLNSNEAKERVALVSKKPVNIKVEEAVSKKKEEKDYGFGAGQRAKGKGPPTDDKELLRQFRLYKDPVQWDSFQMTAGVALKEGGKLKEGPDFASTFVTDPEIAKRRISKEEYQAKMRPAVINKEGLRLDSSTNLKTGTYETSSSLFLQNNLQIRKKHSLLPPLETSESKTGIKVHSSRLLEILANPSETVAQTLPYSPLTERPAHSTRYGTTASEDLSMKVNKTDEFNMKILQSSDWGKQANVHVTTQNPQPFPKISRSAMKTSVGLKMKTPRDRDLRQGYFLSSHYPLRSARESKTQNLF